MKEGKKKAYIRMYTMTPTSKDESKGKDAGTCFSRVGVEILARHPSPPRNATTWIYTG